MPNNTCHCESAAADRPWQSPPTNTKLSFQIDGIATVASLLRNDRKLQASVFKHKCKFPSIFPIVSQKMDKKKRDVLVAHLL
jgi:hypothetical protein